MTKAMKRLISLSIALTLYISGAIIGALGACTVLVMGAISIFWGAPLVTYILTAAGISAIGLTIADIGRKKLIAFPPLKYRYIIRPTTKQVLE